MERYFNFSRFGKVLAYDLAMNFPKFMKTQIGMASVIVLLWLFNISLGGFLAYNDGNTRAFFIISLINISAFIGPAVIYGDCNNRKKGYLFSTLPASVEEKFASMLILCCIIAPLFSFAALFATDTVLTSMKYIGIEGFGRYAIKNGYNFLIPGKNIYMNEYTSLINLSFGNNILPMALLTSIPLLGNAVFRKRKVLKTIATCALIGTLCVIIIIPLLKSFDFLVRLAQSIEYETVPKILLAVQLVIYLGCFAATYIRLKKVTY